MLSPHEFATLILVKDARQPADLDQADLRTLLDRQLVELDEHAAPNRLARLTDRGRALLARLRALRGPDESVPRASVQALNAGA